MNGKIRTRPNLTRTHHHYTKYLKPGALARIRDSKINALTHRLNSPLSHHSNPVPGPGMVAGSELLPEFPISECGPRCFGRKKVFAAKSSFVLEPNTFIVV